MQTNKYIPYLPALLLLWTSLGCAQLTIADPSDSPTVAPTPQLEVLIEYRNSDLGFSFALPSSWDGYSVRDSEWEGLKSGGDQGDEVVARGPVISIVHPKSTPEKPRQDIPIMVLTLDQWDQLQQYEWHIGAAPIGPFELGRNSLYVFALPARYNYAFPEGWEEVDEIIRNHPLLTFEPGVLP